MPNEHLTVEAILAQLETPKAAQQLPAATRRAVISAERALKFIAFANKYRVAPLRLSPDHALHKTLSWLIQPPDVDSPGIVLFGNGHSFRCTQATGGESQPFLTSEHILHPYATDDGLQLLARAALTGVQQSSATQAPYIPRPRPAPVREAGLRFGIVH